MRKRTFEIIDGDIHKTGFLKAKVALFHRGSHRELLESEDHLNNQGVVAIILMNPSPEDITSLKEEDGYYHGPFWVTWHKKAMSYADSIKSRADINNSKKRRKIKKYEYKIRQASGFVVESGPLTRESYLEWHDLYERQMSTRELGARIFKRNLTEADGISKGDLSNWSKIFLRDPESDKIVGGFLLMLYKKESICKIKGAAFDKSEKYGFFSLSLKAFHEVAGYALAGGYETLSYGSDPNFYGEFVGVGLQKHKASLGFGPICFKESEMDMLRCERIIKILNLTTPYMFFTFAGASPLKLKAHVFGDFDIENYTFPWGVEVKRHL